MLRSLAAASLAVLVSLMPCAAIAKPSYTGLFDVAARRAQLQTPAFSAAKQACLAVPTDPKWQSLPVISGLDPTEGYGTDRSANEFNWAVMVLTGRSLAGDGAATAALKNLLLKWSAAKAFDQTAEVHDAYYALKRVMLPTVVAYTVLRPALSADQDKQLRNWIDPLVRRVDQLFDGDVDVNNHRDLADSVLMLWGSVIGDKALYDKGLYRFSAVLASARPDGSLPLETRRGARALWYTRQALTSMVVMAEVARGQGDGLYDKSVNGVSVWTAFDYLLEGISNPILVYAYAAQNYIPGPQDDYRKTDFGFLEKRSNGRNYLASLQAVVAHPPAGLTGERLSDLFDRYAAAKGPLIDEFVGGNASCFWGGEK